MNVLKTLLVDSSLRLIHMSELSARFSSFFFEGFVVPLIPARGRTVTWVMAPRMPVFVDLRAVVYLLLCSTNVRLKTLE